MSADTPIQLDPQRPLSIAETFAERRYSYAPTAKAKPTITLHNHNDEFWAWTGTCYAPVESTLLRKELYLFIDKAVTVGDDPKPINPTRQLIENVMHALSAARHLDGSRTAPFWISKDARSSGLLPMRNGILDIETRSLLPTSPDFFTTFAVPIDYETNPPTPERWHSFLDQLWGDDPASIEFLAEWFGYILSGDTSHQKALMFVGPPRSGKGTCAHAMGCILGHSNIAAPSLGDLSSGFGLMTMVHRPLAIVPDAVMSGKINAGAITERILSITGEDVVQIDRKFKQPWTGKLSSRLWFASNVLPRLSETSTALANRFVYLETRRSFLGKEDRRLRSYIEQEAPGILAFALDGMSRLRERGSFTATQCTARMRDQMIELSSPLTAFVRDCCRKGPDAYIACEELYERYKKWAEQTGQYADSEISFGRNLRTVAPEVERVQKGTPPGRFYAYTGIAGA